MSDSILYYLEQHGKDTYSLVEYMRGELEHLQRDLRHALDFEEKAKKLEAHLCGKLLEYAAAIPGQPLGGLAFHMVPETAYNAVHNLEHHLPVSVFCWTRTGEGTSQMHTYIADVFLEPAREGEQAPSVTFGDINRWDSKTTVVRLNPETGIWESVAALTRVVRALEQGGGEADYLDAASRMEQATHRHLDEETLVNLMARDRRLTKLWDKAEGAARFEFVQSEEGEPMALLVPRDKLRRGCALRTEEDYYVLFQYLNDDDISAALETQGKNLRYNASQNEEPCILTGGEVVRLDMVDSTDSERKILASILTQWDHCARDTVTFCLPLSLDTYVETTTPFGRLTIKNREGAVDRNRLTQDERQALGWVTDDFAKRRIVSGD